MALRVRQVGVKRVLYGSDAAVPGNSPQEAWNNFKRLPLTPAEFAQIATNVAPYLSSKQGTFLLVGRRPTLRRSRNRCAQPTYHPRRFDMQDTKERLSLFWLFALLNYLYADVIALFEIVGSPNLADAPHLPPWALMASSVLMEIPIAMIVASRMLPFRANRLANIIAGLIVTVVNGAVTFVVPLAIGARPPAFPAYLFFGTIETVCTVIIIWQAWTWSRAEAELSPERIVRQPEPGIASS